MGRLDAARERRPSQKPASRRAARGVGQALYRAATRSADGTDSRQGLRGRFAMYVPPLMEALGRAELEHQSRNNRMRAL